METFVGNTMWEAMLIFIGVAFLVSLVNGVMVLLGKWTVGKFYSSLVLGLLGVVIALWGVRDVRSGPDGTLYKWFDSIANIIFGTTKKGNLLGTDSDSILLPLWPAWALLKGLYNRVAAWFRPFKFASAPLFRRPRG